jgi:hypothetical protein
MPAAATTTDHAAWQKEATLMTDPEIHRAIRRLGFEARIRPESLQGCSVKASVFHRELCYRR